MPCSFWYVVSEAFMPEEEKMVLPPSMAFFSRMTIFSTPASLAARAAHMPAPPMPRTTMS